MASSSSSSDLRRSQQEEDDRTEGGGEEVAHGSILPRLPDEVSCSLILPLLPPSLLPSLQRTSSAWRRALVSLPEASRRRQQQQVLCVFPTSPHLLPRPHLLDPSTLLWHPLPPLPPDPHSHSLSHFRPLFLSSSASPSLLLLGGSRFDAHSFPLHLPSPSPSAFLLRLRPLSPRWLPLPDMPTPRGSFACAASASSGRVLAAGGGSRHAVFPCGGTRTAAAEALDLGPLRWDPLPPMRLARAGCVGWLMPADDGEEEFWVVGGYAGYRAVEGVFPEDVHCRDGEVFGLRSGRWRSLGDMWEEGERARLGKVAVVEPPLGTEDCTAVFMLDRNSIFRYDVASNRWFRETILRRKLPHDYPCGFVAMNGELYILTSDPRTPPRKKSTLDMQIYDPKKRKWRFLSTSTPFKQPLDFRIAVLCTVCL